MIDQSGAPGFATLAIHAGAAANSAEGRAPPPNVCKDIAQAAALFGLDGIANDIIRSIHPSNALLEERIAALESGSAALAVASGEAAQFLAFHMLLQPGDTLIAGSTGPRDPLHRIDEAYKSFGWNVTWADPARPESFERALSPRCRAIFIESFAGPDAILVDIAAIAKIAKQARLPLIVDNTLATPYLLRPAETGADIIIHSATKFLGGRETLTGGLIVDAGSFPWQDDPRFPLLSLPQKDYGGMVFAETFGNFAFAMAARMLGLNELGPALSPVNACLILAGLETLALRMQRHCDNALRVAEYLAGHKAIRAVHYAGLRNDPAHALAKLYCPKGAGAILTCQLNGGAEAATGFIQRLRLFSPLGETSDARSRASHPTATPDLVRLAIGLEDSSDIIADLDQAFAG
jgi:O-acetylhomoserine (thiol)-lyase